MAKTELEKPANPSQLVRPDWVPESDWGMEEATLRDMIIPRLGLCQSNSQARDKNHAKYIKGLEEGQFYNSLTGRIYGEKVQVIPLFLYKSRIMFKDMKEGGGIICQAPDGVHCQLNAGGPCLHAQWGASGQPPECTEFFNYPAYVYDGPGKPDDFVVVSLKTTGMEAAKTIVSLIRMRKTAPFAGVFELNSIPDRNKTGQSYYTWMAKNGTPPWVAKELYADLEKTAMVTRDGLKAGTITVDDSSSDDAFAAHDNDEV